MKSNYILPFPVSGNYVTNIINVLPCYRVINHSFPFEYPRFEAQIHVVETILKNYHYAQLLMKWNLWNPNFIIFFKKAPYSEPYKSNSHFPYIHFNIIPLSAPRKSKWLITYQAFQPKFRAHIWSDTMRATCPNHPWHVCS